MFSGLLDQYKRELNEFVSTVKEDTSYALSTAAEKLAQLNQDASSEDKDASLNAASASLKLAKIPDFETFLEVDLESGEHLAGFEDFASSFQLSSREDQIKAASETLLDLYDAYVPDRMTHEDFWLRYFYFQHVQRRARLLAGDIGQQDEEELSWGDEEEEDDDIDEGEDSNSSDSDDGDELEKRPKSRTKVSQSDEDDGDSIDGKIKARGKSGAKARSAAGNMVPASALSEAKTRAALAEQTVEDLRTQIEQLKTRVADLENENQTLRNERARYEAASGRSSPAPSITPELKEVKETKAEDANREHTEQQQMSKEDHADATEESTKASVGKTSEIEEDDLDIGGWEVDDGVLDGSSSASTEPVPVMADEDAADASSSDDQEKADVEKPADLEDKVTQAQKAEDDEDENEDDSDGSDDDDDDKEIEDTTEAAKMSQKKAELDASDDEQQKKTKTKKSSKSDDDDDEEGWGAWE